MKIALVGLSQLSFPGDKEGRFRKSAEDLRALLAAMDASLYVYPETVITPEDMAVALRAIKAECPDFLLAQCTSFSAGFLAQSLAKAGIPLGFWALPEGVEGGVMQLNSLCSINMYMAIVRAYYPAERIPVKWFYGEVGDELFAPRMRVTVKAIKAINAVCSSKVALIGGIAPGFNDLYFDERKLLARFPGLDFNRLHEFSEIADRARSYRDAELIPLAEELEKGAKRGVCACSIPHTMDNARFLKAYRDFIGQYHYDALAISCWPKFMDQFDYAICSVVGQLNDEGVPAACEGDVLSAVSMLLLQRLTGSPAMLMDLSAFDEKDDSILMWHCGPASKAFCREEGYSLSGNYSGKAHLEGQPPVSATLPGSATKCSSPAEASSTATSPAFLAAAAGWIASPSRAGRYPRAISWPPSLTRASATTTPSLKATRRTR